MWFERLHCYNGLHIQGLQLAFGGGTSLAKAGLIKRFSEDVDFKATITPAGHKHYRETRKKIIAAFEDGGLVLVAEPMVRDGSRFFSLELDYGATFMRNQRLRTHIRVEVRFVAPALPDLLTSLLQYRFVGGVLPFYQLLNNTKEPLTLFFLFLFSGKNIGVG